MKLYYKIALLSLRDRRRFNGKIIATENQNLEFEFVDTHSKFSPNGEKQRRVVCCSIWSFDDEVLIPARNLYFKNLGDAGDLPVFPIVKSSLT